MMRALLQNNPKDWDKLLNRIQDALNMVVHAPIKDKASFLFVGREIHHLTEVLARDEGFGGNRVRADRRGNCEHMR